jgi:hypothetical protein
VTAAETHTHRAAAPVLIDSDFASLDDLPAVNPSRRQPTEGFDLGGLDPGPIDEPIDIPTLDHLLADIPPAFEPSPSIDFPADVAPALVAPTISLPSLGLEAADDAPVAAAPPAEPVEDTSSIIADAFTALLAVEAGEPGAVPPRLPVNGASPVLTEAMLEDVARRVAQRVALGSSDQLHRMVKEIVSSVSERLVREEIDRIRRNAPRS